jgi:hypothetical protein
MAFVLPVSRKINEKILGKLVIKACEDDQTTAICFMKIDNCLTFAFYTAIEVGSTATEETVRLLLGVDFVLSLLLYVSLQKNHNKLIGIVPAMVPEAAYNVNKEENKILGQFVLYKSTELIVPITFILAYLMAYYGPNNGIIGTVGCEYWHFRKLTDLSKFVSMKLTMFSVILMTLLLACIIVWAISRKNVYGIFCTFMKKFWYIVMLKAVCNLNCVSNNL